MAAMEDLSSLIRPLKERTQEAARAKQRRWDRSLRFLARKEDWLRRKHPNCWVWIDNGKLRAVAGSFAELEIELTRLGIPIHSAFITFIDEQPTAQSLRATALAA